MFQLNPCYAFLSCYTNSLTGGTNPRKGPSTRNGIGATNSASPSPSTSGFKASTDSATNSEWLTRLGGKNISPSALTANTTPLRFNRSGYPIVDKAPVQERRGKSSALFGALISPTTSNRFQSLATDSSANMDQ